MIGPVTQLPPDAVEPVRDLFGPALPRITEFADLLARAGVERGLIGPREVPRIWERHLLNSAAVAPFLPEAGTVVDVGSGAGLPGVVLACMRPDLHTVLLEPMDRRATWLCEVVSRLELTSTEVVRARAEDLHGRLHAAAAVARAVAPLDRLARWLLPLVDTGGVVLAMKGERAADEVDAARSVVSALGGSSPEVMNAVTIRGMAPTTLVRVVKEREPQPRRPNPRRASRARR